MQSSDRVGSMLPLDERRKSHCQLCLARFHSLSIVWRVASHTPLSICFAEIIVYLYVLIQRQVRSHSPLSVSFHNMQAGLDPAFFPVPRSPLLGKFAIAPDDVAELDDLEDCTNSENESQQPTDDAAAEKTAHGVLAEHANRCPDHFGQFGHTRLYQPSEVGVGR